MEEVLPRQLLFVSGSRVAMGEPGDSGALIQLCTSTSGAGPAVGILHGGFNTLHFGRAAMGCDIVISLEFIKSSYGEQCRKVELVVE